MKTRTAGFVLAAAAALAIAPTTEAQGRRSGETTASPRVLVAKSSGVATNANDPEERAQSRRSPRPLTAAQLSQLLAPLGYVLNSQFGPARLTVSQRTGGGGRFRLSFWNVDQIRSATNEVTMKGFSRVYLKLRALAPNEHYLIQCTLSSPEDSTPEFYLFGPGGSKIVTNSVNVVGVYHAPDTQDALFYIMPTSQVVNWIFSYCDVSPLDPPQTPR